MFSPSAAAKKLPKKLATILHVDGLPIQTTIHLEKRGGLRVSLTKRGLILRLPAAVSEKELQEKIVWASDWLRLLFEKKPKLRAAWQPKSWKSGDEITVGQRKYTLEFALEDRETHNARLENQRISLRLSKKDSAAHLQKSIKTLLSRVIGQDFLPEITRRVHALNRLYFQKNITSVSLKYNATNWGSCSSKDNINLSTRLLFAPPEVVDYVIIHELAHLVEMNHSDRFWKVVARVLPDYKMHERWLKKNGPSCDF